MKLFFTVLAFSFSVISMAQDDNDKKELKAKKKATNYVFEGNKLVSEDFVSAEMEYRKAISESEKSVAGKYNLAHSYYKEGKLEESLVRHQQAARLATTKEEKHRAFHNIGNILMQNELCKEAVEAFKNALRNNPADEESRYNLAIAKECAEQQQDDKGGKDDDKKDEKQEDNKEDDQKKEDQGDDEKKENKDQGDDEKKKGEEKEDENGKPKDEQQKDEKEKGKGDKEKKQQKPKPQPGKLSKQQIKNLLQAMNDKEQKVREKMNAKKQKGAKVKTDKDW